MADLSRQNLKSRHPFRLDHRPYLYDHAFEGKAIFPAVEMMIVLAQTLRHVSSRANLNVMTGAQFNRMLIIDAEQTFQDVQIEIDSWKDAFEMSLLTVAKLKGGAITRSLEHARLTFEQKETLPDPSVSFQDAVQPGGASMEVTAESIYRELVPFGPFYRNITGDLTVSEEGVLGRITGGQGEADDVLLGSPFVLDAAMHAACVWGQRFGNLVGFPVGFDRRIIYRKTKKGDVYLVRITPVDVNREPLIFDAWIFDDSGIIYEEIRGLKMRDITSGRRKPPAWIREGVCKKSL